MKIFKQYVLIAIAIIALAVALAWAIDQKRAEITGAWWRFRYHRLRPMWLDFCHVCQVAELAGLWIVQISSGVMLALLGGELVRG